MTPSLLGGGGMVVRRTGAQLVSNVPLLLILAIVVTGLAVGKAVTVAASPGPTNEDLVLLNAHLEALRTQLGVEIVDRIKADAALTERLATLDARLQSLQQLLWMVLVAFVTNIAVAIRTWMMNTQITRRANNESRTS